MTRRVPVSELQAGEVVVGETRYEVHGVDQAQGQVQVVDVAGTTHTYSAAEEVEVE